MKKLIYPLFFIILCSFTGIAQNVLFKNSIQYGDPILDNWADKIIEYKNKFYITGYDSKTNIHPSSRFILCTDLDGNKIWEKKYNASENIELKVSDENKLILLKNHNLLIEVDENLKEINTTSFKIDNSKYVYLDNNFIHTTNGDIIIGAYCDTINSLFTENKGKNDYWLLRYQKNGNLVWKKNLGTQFHDTGHGIFKSPNNNDFLVGIYSHTYELGQYVGKEIHAIKLDFDGNIIWNTKVNKINSYYIDQSVSSDSKGNLYFAYTKLNNFTISDLIITKVDYKGIISKEIIVNDSYSAIGGMVIENDKIYLNMIHSNFSENTFFSGIKLKVDNYIYSYIVKLNEFLALEWYYNPTFIQKYEVYDKNISAAPNDIVVKNGKVACINSGINYYKNFEPQNSNTNYWLTILQDINDYSKDCIKEAVIYPNPSTSNSTLFIDFKQNYYHSNLVINLYNGLGQLVDSQTKEIIGKQTDYALPNYLTSGIYFLQFYCGKEQFSKKIIIQ